MATFESCFIDFKINENYCLYLSLTKADIKINVKINITN